MTLLLFAAMSLQLCLTLQPQGCSPPGSSAHRILKNTGVGCHTILQEIFPTWGWNPHLLTSPDLAGRFFTTNATWEFQNKLRHLVLQETKVMESFFLSKIYMCVCTLSKYISKTEFVNLFLAKNEDLKFQKNRIIVFSNIRRNSTDTILYNFL